MSYTLNTSHPLYGNLIDLIGVQGGALVSHKTARTFTPHALATYGSGTWGEHFKTGPKAWDFSGATFTPVLNYDTSGGKGFTIFYAVNNIATAADNLGALQQSTVSYAVSTNGQRAVSGNTSDDPSRSLTTVGVGAKSICVTRNGEISNKSYVDGILEYTGGRLGWNQVDAFNSIGGYGGQGVAGGIEFVWVAAFDKVLSDAEVLALHNSLGAGNAFALVSSGGGDTTAPTLTSPSVTAVGATTGTGNVTTDEGNGALYSIVSTSATTPSATQIQAGQNHTGAAAVWSGNQAVSSTGAKTFSITGLTASTAYYAHFQHKDAANNNSTVVTSAQFTTGSADTTVPTLTGSITISSKTTTSYTATWPSGSDNVAITGYEYRLNAGSWVSVGNVLTIGISARTPGSTDTFEVRAYDAAGNKSTPALSTSVTLADIAVGTITFPAVKDWSTGNLKLNESGVTVIVNNVTTGALVIKLTGKTTHATTGVCTVSDALIIAGTQYRATLILADGSEGTWKYSAT